MPSFNFQRQFANKVKRNTKPGTVRAKRKKPMKVGDMMYCFTGMRTKKCKRIVSRKCLAIVDVEISKGGAWIKLNGQALNETDAIAFAELDGFKKFVNASGEKYKERWTVLLSFREFFEAQYGLPFRGDWYVWKKSALEKYGINLTSHV